MMFEKPVLNGKTDKENLHILETWATNLIDKLNHAITHIDSTNVTAGLHFVTESDLDKRMQKQYEDLRRLIIERTKGEDR